MASSSFTLGNARKNEIARMIRPWMTPKVWKAVP